MVTFYILMRAGEREIEREGERQRERERYLLFLEDVVGKEQNGVNHHFLFNPLFSNQKLVYASSTIHHLKLYQKDTL